MDDHTNGSCTNKNDDEMLMLRDSSSIKPLLTLVCRCALMFMGHQQYRRIKKDAASSVSDQDLHYLLTECFIKIWEKYLKNPHTTPK